MNFLIRWIPRLLTTETEACSWSVTYDSELYLPMPHGYTVVVMTVNAHCGRFEKIATWRTFIYAAFLHTSSLSYHNCI